MKKMIITGFLLGLYAYAMKCFLHYFFEFDIIKNIFSLDSFIFTMHLPFVRNGINYLFEKYFDEFKDSKNTHLLGMPLEGPNKEIENNIKLVNLSNLKDNEENLSGNSPADDFSSINASMAKINALIDTNKQLEKDVQKLIISNLHDELKVKYLEYAKAGEAEFSRRNKITMSMLQYTTQAEKLKFYNDHIVELMQWRSNIYKQMLSLNIQDPNFAKKCFDAHGGGINGLLKIHNKMDEFTYDAMKKKVENGGLEKAVLNDYNKNIRVKNDKAIGDYNKWSKNYKSDLAILIDKYKKK
jgi:hypothetical protein